MFISAPVSRIPSLTFSHYESLAVTGSPWRDVNIQVGFSFVFIFPLFSFCSWAMASCSSERVTLYWQRHLQWGRLPPSLIFLILCWLVRLGLARDKLTFSILREESSGHTACRLELVVVLARLRLTGPTGSPSQGKFSIKYKIEDDILTRGWWYYWFSWGPAGGGGGWAVTMTVQTTRVRQQIPMKLITTDFRLNPQQVFSSDILFRPEGEENYFLHLKNLKQGGLWSSHHLVGNERPADTDCTVVWQDWRTGPPPPLTQAPPQSWPACYLSLSLSAVSPLSPLSPQYIVLSTSFICCADHETSYLIIII